MSKFRDRLLRFWMQPLVGYKGICHICDSNITSDIKFGHYYETISGWTFIPAIPLICSYCGFEHKSFFVDKETTLQRKGEVLRLKTKVGND